ncbi:hypothetical protein TrVE_jg5326 [Triparma verrucosa]|uniref:Inward rectifier potassium channel C-terminal domain-containing protein n=2 Tax=Triparma TaxID=722752 RepID=A0A9W7EKZ4_9STRA|nr:hypothetical protein TrST_g13211 [Triparma strigata]GMH85509.1 hypothetical protein TrVE_jg5326 [Triparma verrucosa]
MAVKIAATSQIKGTFTKEKSKHRPIMSWFECLISQFIPGTAVRDRASDMPPFERMRTPYPVKLVNQSEREPLFSRFLYMVMFMDMRALLIWPFFMLMFIGLLFGLLNKYALKCHDLDQSDPNEMMLLNYVVLAVGGLIGNHLLTEDDVRDKPLCVLSVSVSGYVGLIVQAIVFGLVCQRVLRPPQHEMVLADKCVIAPRNGKPVVRFRITHKFGRATVNLHVKAWWRLSIKTDEGEGAIVFKEMKIDPQGVWCYAPMTFTHVVDEDSPLYQMLEKDSPHKIENPLDKLTLDKVKAIKGMSALSVWAIADNPTIGGQVDCQKVYSFKNDSDVVIGKASDCYKSFGSNDPGADRRMVIDFAGFKEGAKVD